MIAIDNINGSGGTVDFNNVYNNLKILNSAVSELESYTTLTDDIAVLQQSCLNLSSSLIGLNDSLITDIKPSIDLNISNIGSLSSSLLSVNSSLASLQQSCSDITNSLSNVASLSTLSNLSTLNGVFSAPYFNNQAFDMNGQLYPMTNRTLNFNSEMYFTGFFSLPKSTMNYTQAYWNLSNLKSVYVSYIDAKTINDLSVYNFGFGDCKLWCRTCHFDKCEFRWCTISAWDIGKLENCKVGLSCRFEKCSNWEFSNVNFSYSSCGFASGKRIRFENVNFDSNFRCGLSNNDYIIYLHDCLINSSTFETNALSNIFTCDHSIQFIV